MIRDKGETLMKNIVMWCLPGLLAMSGAVWVQAQQATEAGKSAVPPTGMAKDASKAVQRGERLATFGGCHDCHTPKLMTPKGPELDKSRLLSGYPSHALLPAVPQGIVGPARWGAIAAGDLTAWVGPWGISFAANLTPDVTGLGGWTEEQFIQTMRTGKHLGVGRAILPPMPWFDVAALTDPDLKALFAYLKSLKPIANRVPQPVPPK
jgi:mono/diheme cytochrome c family protein